jgi:hypothetical protein
MNNGRRFNCHICGAAGCHNEFGEVRSSPGSSAGAP